MKSNKDGNYPLKTKIPIKNFKIVFILYDHKSFHRYYKQKTVNCKLSLWAKKKLKHLRGTISTSLFFFRLSPLWPPAQSPMVKRGVCLHTSIYSLWYSFSLLIGFFADFCFSCCDNSLTGNHEFPHVTYSSKVSYMNLYCSYCENKHIYFQIYICKLRDLLLKYTECYFYNLHY